MKIAFLNIYQSNVSRGAETFVEELGKRLKTNHKVDIISSNMFVPQRWPIWWRTYLDPQGLKILLFTISNLYKIWKEKYDVVIPLNSGWQPLLVRIVTWFYGGKMVISGQSGDGWDDRINLWSFPDSFVALSSKSLSWAKGNAPFVKSVYIPNGVDIKIFKPEGEKFKSNLNQPIILSVGALTHQKRIDLVIKAVSHLPNANLLVAGDGYLKKDILNLGNRLLGKRFQLISVPYEKMPSVYRSAKVFTLVSESSESFGNVFTEAMASGLAIVARNDSKRREIIGDSGIFVNPENINEYSQALKSALEMNNCDKFIKQSLKFNWDNICKRYEELFKELVKVN